MELKIIKGSNNNERPLLKIATENTQLVVVFGEDLGTGEISQKINPAIDGLTCGTPKCDGVFVFRNPENCSFVEYKLKEIPIYMQTRQRANYNICCDFLKITKTENIIELTDSEPIQIKDIEITSCVIDNSNFNTHIIKFTDTTGKSVVVCGDFRNYDLGYAKDKLNKTIALLESADYIVVEGKYLGKTGQEYSSGKAIHESLKNIMKQYKQVLVIQSATDMITTANMYEAAKKTKKIFVEDSFLCNITTVANGSVPNPITGKKVYSYSPVALQNLDMEFKKKYITPYYINNGIEKMKKENFLININKDMIQDIQLFLKQEMLYNACVVIAEGKKNIENDEELDEFIKMLKESNIDSYELYTKGSANIEVISKIVSKLDSKAVIPIDYGEEIKSVKDINNLKFLEFNTGMKF